MVMCIQHIWIDFKWGYICLKSIIQLESRLPSNTMWILIWERTLKWNSPYKFPYFLRSDTAQQFFCPANIYQYLLQVFRALSSWLSLSGSGVIDPGAISSNESLRNLCCVIPFKILVCICKYSKYSIRQRQYSYIPPNTATNEVFHLRGTQLDLPTIFTNFNRNW